MMRKWTPKNIRKYALDFLAGKTLRSWVKEDTNLMKEIEAMARTIRDRKERRGQPSIKITFPKFNKKQDDKSCNFCYPNGKSYNYVGHGRISHTDMHNELPATITGEDEETPVVACPGGCCFEGDEIVQCYANEEEWENWEAS